MKCPVDGSPLIVVERHKIELDYCTVCKGIWFDEGELRLLATALNKNIELPDITTYPTIEVSEKPRKSPRSGKKMDKINMGGDDAPVIIDRDPAGLGLWFDWGELGQVIEKNLKSSKEAGEGEIIKFLGETFKF